MTGSSYLNGNYYGLQLLLKRLPGSHGLGFIPWIVPLLLGLGAVSAATQGQYAPEWIRVGVLLNFGAWLAQGLVLVLIRRRAIGIQPTVTGGVITLILFALIGAVGGIILVIGYSAVTIPSRPNFFQPFSVMSISVLTWTCVGSIVALTYSWRDQLNDTMIAASLKLSAKTQALSESAEIDSRQRQVVIRSLQTRVLPQLTYVLSQLRSSSTTTGSSTETQSDLADVVEILAQHEIRSMAHLLHPQGMALGITPVLTSVANEFRDQVEIRCQSTHEQPAPSQLLIREAAVTLSEILHTQVELTREPIDVVVVYDQQVITMIVRVGATEITKVCTSLTAPNDPNITTSTRRQWFRFRPSSGSIPWFGISLLNAFSVLTATALSGAHGWFAAAVDIFVITSGTFILYLLVKTPIVGGLSATNQWVFVAVYVACLGALAGAAWGAALGEEALSLALMGLICALSVGLFAPARKVWASETRKLQQEIYLTELETESTAFAADSAARQQRNTAADVLHSVVQSRLLGVAGSIGGASPGEIPQAAIDALSQLQLQVIPKLVSDLEKPNESNEPQLITQKALSDTWPGAIFTLKHSSPIPEATVPLVNGIILESTSNAVVHGRATQISINIAVWPAALEFTVEDNGCGFSPHTRKGLGLQALDAVSMKFSLTSRPNGGSRLHLRVPYFAD